MSLSFDLKAPILAVTPLVDSLPAATAGVGR